MPTGITKEYILSGSARFILSRDEVQKFIFTVKRTTRGLSVRGAAIGGKPKYIGILQPLGGSLLRTHKSLLTRHLEVARVFRWFVSIVWWQDSIFPTYFKAEKA